MRCLVIASPLLVLVFEGEVARACVDRPFASFRRGGFVDGLFSRNREYDNFTNTIIEWSKSVTQHLYTHLDQLLLLSLISRNIN